MMEERYPEAFLDRMRGQLKNEMPAFLRALNEPALRGIRFNPMKPCRMEMIPGIGEKIPWEPEGYYLSTESDAGNRVLHEAGAYYIQEPSAMLPARVMNAQPGEKILDLCAAPGGKSTQLAAMMNGQGLLVCNEPVPKRALILSRNIERLGIGNALVISAYPDQIAKQWPEGFDGVQTDAPCSGEGMFRKHPETRTEWSPENAAGCAERQAEILDAAALLVRNGGRIVYSTCTMNPAENEETVRCFLKRHPEFEPEGFELNGGIQAPDGMFMMYPHRFGGEGQFVAKLRKRGNAVASLPENRSFSKPDKTETGVVKSFECNAPEITGKIGNVLFSLPDCPETGRLKVYRAGIHLGELRGRIFIPDHAWALAGSFEKIPFTGLEADAAVRYMSGETVDGDTKGWQILTYDGCALGWGKGSDGIIKNHYPKGLRKSLTSDTVCGKISVGINSSASPGNY